jgi:hypothetical protein
MNGKQVQLDEMFEQGVGAAEIANIAVGIPGGYKGWTDAARNLLIDLINIARAKGEFMADVRAVVKDSSFIPENVEEATSVRLVLEAELSMKEFGEIWIDRRRGVFPIEKMDAHRKEMIALREKFDFGSMDKQDVNGKPVILTAVDLDEARVQLNTMLNTFTTTDARVQVDAAKLMVSKGRWSKEQAASYLTGTRNLIDCAEGTNKCVEADQLLENAVKEYQ